MTAEVTVPVPVGQKPDVELAWVPCWQMTALHPFQRAQDPARVEAMKSKWKDDLIGAVVLVENPNYKRPRASRRITPADAPGAEVRYWVIEGGHRHQAAMGKFGGGYLLPSIIVALDTVQEIAQNFLDINGQRRGIAKRDQYTVGTNADMEPYRSINEILAKHDLSSGHTQRDHNIGALGTLVSIYNQWGGEVLDQTIITLIDAFGYMQTTWSAPILMAVAEIYGINSNVDAARLVSILNARDGRAVRDPKRWEMMGVAARQSAGGSQSRGAAVCEVMVKKYNAGIKRSEKISATRPRPLSGAAAAKAQSKADRESGTITA